MTENAVSQPSTDMSTFRLYLLRALYGLIFVGLALTVWPGMINHGITGGTKDSMLVALSLLALLGIRYPVQMLPLLFFEFLWKSIWLIAIALPSWSTHRLDDDMMESIKACLMGVVLVPIAVPWRYVWDSYVKKPAEREAKRDVGTNKWLSGLGGALVILSVAGLMIFFIPPYH